MYWTTRLAANETFRPIKGPPRAGPRRQGSWEGGRGSGSWGRVRGWQHGRGKAASLVRREPRKMRGTGTKVHKRSCVPSALCAHTDTCERCCVNVLGCLERHCACVGGAVRWPAGDVVSETHYLGRGALRGGRPCGGPQALLMVGQGRTLDEWEQAMRSPRESGDYLSTTSLLPKGSPYQRPLTH